VAIMCDRRVGRVNQEGVSLKKKEVPGAGLHRPPLFRQRRAEEVPVFGKSASLAFARHQVVVNGM
jgi:hypothetical protein